MHEEGAAGVAAELRAADGVVAGEDGGQVRRFLFNLVGHPLEVAADHLFHLLARLVDREALECVRCLQLALGDKGVGGHLDGSRARL